MRRFLAAFVAFMFLAGFATLVIEVRQCRQTVAAAENVLDVTAAAFQASADGHEASADDDIVGMMTANATMADLMPDLTENLDAYTEAREKC